MRICIISEDFHPAIGGVAAHVLHLSRSLAKKGNQVTVLSIRYGRALPRRELLEGVEILRVLVPDVPKVRGLCFVLAGGLTLLALSLRRRFDVVHWHNIFADTLIARAVPAKRKIFTNHTSSFLDIYEAGRKKRLFKLLFAAADEIIAPSRELAEKSERFLERPGDEVHYIPNGVDSEKFRPLGQSVRDKIRREWSASKKLPGRSGIIFCPRRLEPKNGVLFGVQAMPFILKEFPEALLVIAGNDAVPKYAQEVRGAISSLGLARSIILLGPVPNSEMAFYYGLAHVALLPSLQEATSIAGLEAMASGVPLVGTRVGGIPEIVEDGRTGMLVPPEDPGAIAEAVLKLLKDPALAFEMGANSRRRAVAEFSWEVIAEKTLRVYAGGNRNKNA